VGTHKVKNHSKEACPLWGSSKPYRKNPWDFLSGKSKKFVGIIFQRPTLDKLLVFSTHFV
jgi:hypothetical protein